MRVITIVSLGASAVLGLAALVIAKTVLPNQAAAKVPGLTAEQTTGVPVVVASRDMKYGDKVDADHLRLTRLPPEAVPMTPEQAMYLVFFDFDSSTIGAGAQNVLDAVAAEVGKRHPAAIHIVGHTDASGSKSYNNKLSLKRANAVRDALASRGIDASMFQIENRGEDDLLVQTADGVREPANRRAQITFQ